MRYLLLLLCTITALAVQAQPKRSSYTVKIENPITGEMDERTIFVPDTCFGTHNGKGQIRTVNMPVWVIKEVEEMYDILMMPCEEEKYIYYGRDIADYFAFKLGKNTKPIYIYEYCYYEKEWNKMAKQIAKDSTPNMSKLVNKVWGLRDWYKIVATKCFILGNEALVRKDTVAAYPYYWSYKKYMDFPKSCGIMREHDRLALAFFATQFYHYQYNRNNIDSAVKWIMTIALEHTSEHDTYRKYQKEAATFAIEKGFAAQLRQAVEEQIKKRGLSGNEHYIKTLKENSIYQFL